MGDRSHFVKTTGDRFPFANPPAFKLRWAKGFVGQGGKHSRATSSPPPEEYGVEHREVGVIRINHFIIPTPPAASRHPSVKSPTKFFKFYG